MLNVWSEVARRGVFRTLVVYVGACWGLVQGADFFVSRYQWTDALVDLLLLGAAALLPLALWLAWEIGAAGPVRRPRRLWWASALYSGCALSALALVFPGSSLGRATTSVEIVDERGQTVTHEVPRADLKRSLALAPFAAATPTVPSWLALGATDLLTVDLSQHRFLVVNALFLDEVKAAASRNGGRAPVAVLAANARDSGARFLLDGTVAGDAAQTRLQLVLYATEPVRELARFELGPAPLDQVVDQASVALKPHLDLSAERAAGDYDLPVLELLSPNPQAVQLLLEANADMYDGVDLDRARARLREAIGLDPGFALAGVRLNLYGYLTNQPADREAGVRTAMGNLARLTEPMQCQVRISDAYIRLDIARAERVARGCVELFPNDADARRMYAGFLARDPQRMDAAIAQYQALYDLGPTHDSALREIARLLALRQDFDGAAAALQRYRARHPDDASSAVQLADLEQRRGQFDVASEVLLDAQARGDTVAISTALSNLYLRRGDMAAAEATLQPWLQDANPITRINALLQTGVIWHARGRHRDALAQYESAVVLVPAGQRALFRLQMLTQARSHQVRLRGLATIQAELAAAVPGTDPQSEFQRTLVQLQYALEGTDRAALEAALARFAPVRAQFQFTELGFWEVAAQARLAELAGDASTAATQYLSALQDWNRSSIRSGMSEVWLLEGCMRNLIPQPEADTKADCPTRLELGYPGLPAAQLTLAEYALARGDSAKARTLLAGAAAALADADTDAPLRQRLQTAMQQLP